MSTGSSTSIRELQYNDIGITVLLVFCHISDKTLTKEFRNDLDFLDSFVRLEGNVGHAGVHHQRKQVQDQVGVSDCTKRTISMKIWRQKCSDWNK